MEFDLIPAVRVVSNMTELFHLRCTNLLVFTVNKIMFSVIMRPSLYITFTHTKMHRMQSTYACKHRTSSETDKAETKMKSYEAIIMQATPSNCNCCLLIELPER